MEDQLHMPWERDTLKPLLEKIVKTGETSKVDLKSIFTLSSGPEQAEFLKDVSAMANTYSHHYFNFGFIIYGATSGNLSYCSFPNNEDHIQASIDDLVKKYLGPFIVTHFYIFEDQGKSWGVLAIPPTGVAPHIFLMDTHKRYRGDVYVRNGTTTEKAQPGDYARFYRQHLEEHTYELRESIRGLQREMKSLTNKIKRTPKNTPPRAISVVSTEPAPVHEQVSIEVEPQGIVEKVNSLLAKEEDKLTKGLVLEVKKIYDFLSTDVIPWSLGQPNKEEASVYLGKLEEACSPVWEALVNLTLNDEKGKYEDAIVQTIARLSKKPEIPVGMSFSTIGENIRYYPLFIALNVVFIAATAKKRDKLLKKIVDLNLKGKTRYDQSYPISYVLFLIRRAGEAFHPMHEGYPNNKWCDPVASYSKALIDKIFSFDEFEWDSEREYYRGEFLLCLTPHDALTDQGTPLLGQPSSGLYLFMNPATYVLPRFLREEKDWIQKIFKRPLKEILKEFDEIGPKLAFTGGCFGNGFPGTAYKDAYAQEKPA